MRVIEGAAHRERREVERSRPGLDVSVLAIDGSEGRPTLRIRVEGGATPLRLHLYVDGALVESWSAAAPLVSFDPGALDPGRHAVTARAVDATGRWGGSSIVVSRCP